MIKTYKQIALVRERLTKWFNTVSELYSTEDTILECMALRGYFSEEMFNHLTKERLFKIDVLSDATLTCSMTEQELEECGLVQNGIFLLAGRYCLPIRDIVGRVSAIVGYYPCERKYVTTPTFGFSKATSFYGVEHTDYFDKPFVVLCEGIFDTASLHAWGIPALGNQGLDLSGFKSEMLSRYKKIIAIPDADKAGKSVNPYMRSYSSNKSRKWVIPVDNCFIDLTGTGVKDVDDYLKDEDRARLFHSVLSNTGRYLQRL